MRRRGTGGSRWRVRSALLAAAKGGRRAPLRPPQFCRGLRPGYGCRDGDRADPLRRFGAIRPGRRRPNGLAWPRTGWRWCGCGPAIVYGPGSVLWVARLAERIPVGPLGGVRRRWRRNLQPGARDRRRERAQAGFDPARHRRAACSTSAAPETMTWNEWFRRMAEAIASPRLRPVSPGALWARSLASLPVKALARARPGLAQWLAARCTRPQRTGAICTQGDLPHPGCPDRAGLGTAGRGRRGSGRMRRGGCGKRDPTRWRRWHR